MHTPFETHSGIGNSIELLILPCVSLGAARGALNGLCRPAAAISGRSSEFSSPRGAGLQLLASAAYDNKVRAQAL